MKTPFPTRRQFFGLAAGGAAAVTLTAPRDARAQTRTNAHIVIIGAGAGGTALANRLVRRLDGALMRFLLGGTLPWGTGRSKRACRDDAQIGFPTTSTRAAPRAIHIIPSSARTNPLCTAPSRLPFHVAPTLGFLRLGGSQICLELRHAL